MKKNHKTFWWPYVVKGLTTFKLHVTFLLLILNFLVHLSFHRTVRQLLSTGCITIFWYMGAAHHRTPVCWNQTPFSTDCGTYSSNRLMICNKGSIQVADGRILRIVSLLNRNGGFSCCMNSNKSWFLGLSMQHQATAVTRPTRRVTYSWYRMQVCVDHGVIKTVHWKPRWCRLGIPKGLCSLLNSQLRQ